MVEGGSMEQRGKEAFVLLADREVRALGRLKRSRENVFQKDGSKVNIVP